MASAITLTHPAPKVVDGTLIVPHLLIRSAKISVDKRLVLWMRGTGMLLLTTEVSEPINRVRQPLPTIRSTGWFEISKSPACPRVPTHQNRPIPGSPHKVTAATQKRSGLLKIPQAGSPPPKRSCERSNGPVRPRWRRRRSPDPFRGSSPFRFWREPR